MLYYICTLVWQTVVFLKRGVLECYDKKISRLSYHSGTLESLHALTKVQEIAYSAIKKTFETKPVCLLHGVSLCGKTEISLHLIFDTLKQGKQVLDRKSVV